VIPAKLYDHVAYHWKFARQLGDFQPIENWTAAPGDALVFWFCVAVALLLLTGALD
jgi:hypothetical protein